MTLHITQFTGIGSATREKNTDGPIQAAKGPCGSETIVLSDINQVSDDFGGGTHVVRVVAQVDAFIALGTAPNATEADERMFLPAKSVEYFSVDPGQKIAGIEA